ncbi:hypothetical protein BJ322DRAFT_427256 [Thelephora terrestris]|uniref:Uncharacterized protein n=1 Tax=Thelephora terrestris TaxID=56493 RepID=A0A9P6LAS7_9AGAM|nr:hypothetical protein BJ322DRAFT_427256 [Thelephora terrestris]
MLYAIASCKLTAQYASFRYLKFSLLVLLPPLHSTREGRKVYMLGIVSSRPQGPTQATRSCISSRRELHGSGSDCDLPITAFGVIVSHKLPRNSSFDFPSRTGPQLLPSAFQYTTSDGGETGSWLWTIKGNSEFYSPIHQVLNGSLTYMANVSPQVNAHPLSRVLLSGRVSVSYPMQQNEAQAMTDSSYGPIHVPMIITSVQKKDAGIQRNIVGKFVADARYPSSGPLIILT